MRIMRRQAAGIQVMNGYGYVYICPCAWEDHCKIGFSRDPLSRIQSLHRRWFEFFDLDQAVLVETESVRDARDLELELRRPLASHNAPAPLTVRR
jgi:Meiotically Up-regulated Gene 113 (MUG113) protein